jgi:hypothetical protein
MNDLITDKEKEFLFKCKDFVSFVDDSRKNSQNFDCGEVEGFSREFLNKFIKYQIRLLTEHFFEEYDNALVERIVVDDGVLDILNKYAE